MRPTLETSIGAGRALPAAAAAPAATGRCGGVAVGNADTSRLPGWFLSPVFFRSELYSILYKKNRKHCDKIPVIMSKMC
jgi:hypothetical protein